MDPTYGTDGRVYNNARQERSRVQITGIAPLQCRRLLRETKTVYEFLGSFYHGCKCQSMRDYKTLDEDTLAERYEKTMSRIEQIAAVDTPSK